jgi:hypothetical protein
MSAKMLTEREAWLQVAELWDGAYESVSGIITDNCDSGICTCIDDLEDNLISPDMADSMRDKIEGAKTKKSDVWLFPLTMEGAQQRAAFCRAQARKLAKKGGKRA